MNNTDINATLEQRGKQYGEFEHVAQTHCKLLETLAEGLQRQGIQKISPALNTAVDMILMKLARFANGDPMHADNFHDIAGYAMLAEEWINKQKLD